MIYQEIAKVFNNGHVQSRVVEGKQGQQWITIGPNAEFRLQPTTLYARIEQKPDGTLTMEQGYKTKADAEAPEAGVKVLPAVEYQA